MYFSQPGMTVHTYQVNTVEDGARGSHLGYIERSQIKQQKGKSLGLSSLLSGKTLRALLNGGFRIPEGKMAKPEEKPERDKTHCSTSTVEAKLPNQCTQKSPAPPEARASLCAKLQPFPGSGLLTEPLCCYGVRMIDICQPFVFLHSLG